MTKLSVNINKIATLRNARGGAEPNVIKAALAIQNYGAQGITVHPRPDERHIRRDDVYALKDAVYTEFNIEGYPNRDFLALIKDIQPDQVTLVPDGPDVLTSNAGWDCVANQDMLTDIVSELKAYKARVSLFLDPDPSQIEAAKLTGTDRIELYTETYANQYSSGAEKALAPFLAAAKEAKIQDLGVNAGHDLNLENLKYFRKTIDPLEVSIGHALISDALYYGLNNSVQMYLNQLAVE